MVGRAVLVCGPTHGGACCVGLCSPSWWGVVCWCVPPSLFMVGRAVSVCAPLPWWGVLRWFVAPLVVGPAALVGVPPLSRGCRVGACPPRSWCVVWGVVICSVGCGRGCVVGLAGVGVVLVCVPSPVGACRVCAWRPPWWGVLCRSVRVSVRGVVAGWMPALFCWSAVVSAAVQPALSGVGCLWRRPCRGWCSAGAYSPPCWGIPCLCLAPPLVGRAVLVRGPPLAGACCVGGRLLWWWCLVWGVVGLWLRLCCCLGRGWCCAGACPPPCWGVSCLCVPPPLVGSAASASWGFGSWCCSWLDARLVLLVRCCLPAARPALSGVGYLCCLPGRGWCCAGACPPPPWLGVLRLVVAPIWSGVLCWCMPPLLLGCAVLVPACRGGCVWLRLLSPVGWVVVVVVLLAWPGLVLCWCVPPPPVGAGRVCAWPPPCWGVLCRRVRVSARGVVAGWMLSLFCWSAVVSAAIQPALSGVCCLWCVRGRGRCCVGACPPRLLGRAVLVRAPPLGGACCVGVFGFWLVVL